MAKRSLAILFVLTWAWSLGGGALAENIASIIQTGDSNQVDYVEQAGDFNEAFITQIGDENEATRQIQIGASNYVYTHQEGYRNKAFIKQDGNNNASNCSAADGRDFTFKIDDKTHVITSPIFSTFPYTQYQNGNDNKVYADIPGSFNNTCQWQEGNGNTASIKITGDYNIAKQVQLNNSNVANIMIDGESNTAYQYQDGGHFSTITVEGSGIFVYIEGSGSYNYP